MKKVYICSPCKGDINGNREKTLLYSKYVMSQGFIPFAPHLYFTEFSEFLDDDKPKEREIVLRLALEWLFQCNEVWVFGETISEGMKNEIEIANKIGIKVIHVKTDDVKNFFNKTTQVKSIEQLLVDELNERFANE